jgi:hypothetical protein
MPRIDSLPFTREVLGCIVGLALAALAVNEYSASTSSAFARSNPEYSRSASAPYPVRLSLVPARQAGANYHPARIKAGDSSWPRGTGDPGALDALPATLGQSPKQDFKSTADRSSPGSARPPEANFADIAAYSGKIDQIVRSAPSMATKPSKQALAEIIDIRYELTAQNSASKGLAIRKPLFVNGAANGQVTLQIINDSTIVAKLADLQRAFGESLPAGIRQRSGDVGYVDFRELRSAGIAVRYVASKDVVEMTAKSETG